MSIYIFKVYKIAFWGLSPDRRPVNAKGYHENATYSKYHIASDGQEQSRNLKVIEIKIISILKDTKSRFFICLQSVQKLLFRPKNILCRCQKITKNYHIEWSLTKLDECKTVIRTFAANHIYIIFISKKILIG